MKPHNKKRNAALLFEFLVGKITESLINDDKHTSGLAIKLLKKHFKPGTELYREFRLSSSLLKTSTSSDAVATSILSEAKAAARSIDVEKLEREKSLLIRDINHGLNAEGGFYDRQVADYKMYATIGTLMSEWRRPADVDIERLVEYEGKLVEWLTSPRARRVDLGEMIDGSVDKLVLKLMSEKLTKKYDGRLSSQQRELLGMYAFSLDEPTSGLRERLDEIRKRASTELDSYLSTLEEGAFVRKALLEVRDAVLTKDIQTIDDASVSTYMKVLQLLEELQRDQP